MWGKSYFHVDAQSYNLLIGLRVGSYKWSIWEDTSDEIHIIHTYYKRDMISAYKMTICNNHSNHFIMSVKLRNLNNTRSKSISFETEGFFRYFFLIIQLLYTYRNATNIMSKQ